MQPLRHADGSWQSMQTGSQRRAGLAQAVGSRVMQWLAGQIPQARRHAIDGEWMKCAPESEKPRPYSVQVSLPAWQHEHPWLGAALPGSGDLGTFLQQQQPAASCTWPAKGATYHRHHISAISAKLPTGGVHCKHTHDAQEGCVFHSKTSSRCLLLHLTAPSLFDMMYSCSLRGQCTVKV